MEKKVVRVKCSGCASTYKVKAPVTDKPVSFKCKKCGKVLKLRLKTPETSPPPPPPMFEPPAPDPMEFSFETTQLPDVDTYQSAPIPNEPAPEIEGHVFEQAPAFEPPKSPAAKDQRSWLVLTGDTVKGPFSDREIIVMIQQGDVVEDTQLKLGERPWIKAHEVAAFKKYLSPQPTRSSLTLTDEDEPEENPKRPSREKAKVQAPTSLKDLATFPFQRENLPSFGIFAGIAVALSMALLFVFLVGLPLNIVGWVVLYGYLAALLNTARKSADPQAPHWNVDLIKAEAGRGASTLLTFLFYSLLPVTILILLMIAGFLNQMPELGYIAIALIPIYYALSLFILPAALVLLNKSGLAAALNPLKAISLVKNGGADYRSMALVCVGLGMLGFGAALAAVFLTDLELLGPIIAGLLMGIVLSYANFLWFYLVGRFTAEHETVPGKTLAVAKA